MPELEDFATQTIDPAPAKVVIYIFGPTDHPGAEVRWHALNADGIVLYDSGSEGDSGVYNDKPEKAIYADIASWQAKNSYPDLPIEDDRDEEAATLRRWEAATEAREQAEREIAAIAAGQLPTPDPEQALLDTRTVEERLAQKLAEATAFPVPEPVRPEQAPPTLDPYLAPPEAVEVPIMRPENAPPLVQPYEVSTELAPPQPILRPEQAPSISPPEPTLEELEQALLVTRPEQAPELPYEHPPYPDLTGQNLLPGEAEHGTEEVK